MERLKEKSCVIEENIEIMRQHGIWKETQIIGGNNIKTINNFFKPIISYQSAFVEIRDEETTWEKREKRKTWLNKIAGL